MKRKLYQCLCFWKFNQKVCLVWHFPFFLNRVQLPRGCASRRSPSRLLFKERVAWSDSAFRGAAAALSAAATWAPSGPQEEPLRWWQQDASAEQSRSQYYLIFFKICVYFFREIEVWSTEIWILLWIATNKVRFFFHWLKSS